MGEENTCIYKEIKKFGSKNIFIFSYKEMVENAPTLPHFRNGQFLDSKNEPKRLIPWKCETKQGAKMWEISSHINPTHPTLKEASNILNVIKMIFVFARMVLSKEFRDMAKEIRNSGCHVSVFIVLDSDESGEKEE